MHPVYNAVVYFVWFLATYYSVFFLLSLLTFNKNIFENKTKSSIGTPFVSIIVPAFNEEESIRGTIESLKKLTYQKLEIIIINDGSSDKTANIVKKEIMQDNRFRLIDNKINQGKATILNQGIDLANGKLIACMDADSIVEENIVQKILPYFDSSKVGAVTVSVDVHKPKTLLHKITALEFALGLSLFLKIFSFLDCIFVTPGPFSVYRKSTLKKVGGFNKENITEDHEIAFRLHRHGYKIKNCIEAKVYTILPGTFKGIYVQRRRWYSGAIQTFFQHKDMLGKKRYGLFSYFIPYNFFLILLGLVLFTMSTVLWITKNLRELWYYHYTGFNFFENFRLDFDILYYGNVNILGLSLLMATLLLMIVGIISTKRKFREHRVGVLGYPFLFFLYQIYWGGALLAVLKRKKIKWR
ncbi:MAG: glycosyltransferase [Candidatus Nanoarchaeia archaeon]